MSNNKGHAKGKSDHPHEKQLTRIERQAIKRDAAEQRRKQHEARSPQQQLDLLVERGHGHCGEAVALRALIEAA